MREWGILRAYKKCIGDIEKDKALKIGLLLMSGESEDEDRRDYEVGGVSG